MTHDRPAATRTDPAPVPAAGAAWRSGLPLFDDLVLVAPLGSGGQGEVWQVDHAVTRQASAVKRLRQVGAAARVRFFAELVAWQALPAHPHLLACRFHRSQADELFIVTDLMPGGSLADRLAGGQPLALPALLDLAAQLASALATLHAWRQVHQDVKPGNLLFDADGAMRLSDFGLARAWVPEDAKAGDRPAGVTHLGLTPAYAAPEQSARARAEPAADVFAWAVTLLHAQRGQRDWEAGATLAGGRPLDDAHPLACPLAECLHPDPSRRPSMDTIWRSLQALGARAAPPGPPPADTAAAMPVYQARLTTSRTMHLGPVGWAVRAQVDFGLRLPEAGPPPQGSRARLAYDLEALLRYRDLYREALPQRPALAPRLQALLAEIALAQQEAGDLDAAIDSAVEATRLESVGGDRRSTLDAALVATRMLRRRGRLWAAVALATPTLADATDRGEPGRKLIADKLALELGHALADLDDGAEARRWYARVHDRAGVPAGLAAVARLEAARSWQGEGRLEEARQAAEAGIEAEAGLEVEPVQRAASWLLHATILSDLGRHGAALASYRRGLAALEAAPEAPADEAQLMAARLRMSRSLSLMALDRDDEARHDLETTIATRSYWVLDQGRSEHADELARAWRHLATLHERRGDGTAAVEALTMAERLYRQIDAEGQREVGLEWGDVCDRLGQALARAGRVEAGRDRLAQAAQRFEAAAAASAGAPPPGIVGRWLSAAALGAYLAPPDAWPAARAALDRVLGVAARTAATPWRLHETGRAWMAHARLARPDPVQVQASAEQAFLAWWEAAETDPEVGFVGGATSLVDDHLAWARARGLAQVWRHGVHSMQAVLDEAARRAGGAAGAAADAWRERYFSPDR